MRSPKHQNITQLVFACLFFSKSLSIILKIVIAYYHVSKLCCPSQIKAVDFKWQSFSGSIDAATDEARLTLSMKQFDNTFFAVVFVKLQDNYNYQLYLRKHHLLATLLQSVKQSVLLQKFAGSLNYLALANGTGRQPQIMEMKGKERRKDDKDIECGIYSTLLN